MKKLFVSLMLIASVNLFADGIHWTKTICAAIEKAKKENKPIMFVVSRHTCKYCKVLKNTTFKDKRVIKKLNKNYVTVIAWTDDGDFVPPGLYPNGTPAMWFLYKDGYMMYRNPAVGAIPADDFVKILDEVKKAFDDIQKRERKGKK